MIEGEKKMKKISFILVTLALLLSLTACGKFTCDVCGKEKTGKQHKDELFGAEVIICDDCWTMMNNFHDMVTGN